MPHVKVGDIQIYYEIHGTGPQTLTMIRGLGSSLAAWYAQVAEFSKNFQTVVFDNRGSGRTDKPDAAYCDRILAALQKGAKHFVQKPVRPDVLYEIIRYVLGEDAEAAPLGATVATLAGEARS